MSKDAVGTCPVLPSKEAGLLRDVSKLYDEKNFKKAVKVADQVGSATFRCLHKRL
jgi:hypothetical protein